MPTKLQMIIKSLLLASALTLAGCGSCNRSMAYLTGEVKTCVDGVLYYQFPSGAAVAYDQEGKVRKC